jgi:perosamine synthetase
MTTSSQLALFGGPQAITMDPGDAFAWPILTAEDEAEVLQAMRQPGYFEVDTFLTFEQEFAAWCGVEFALSHDTHTAAILAAMFACGVGHGDEIIAPSATDWRSVLPCFRLGATMVFADIDPLTLGIDPNDIEHRISERTKAILVVHQLGYPVDMDAINAIARRHHLKVIEDASEAHGSRYKGRKAGTLGDVAVFSLDSTRSIALGEGSMVVTNNRDIYERAIAWAHNFRFNHLSVENPALLRFAGLPMGGITSRMHNLTADIGRTQLRHYDARMREIDQAMHYFWDLLDDIDGLVAHRPPRDSGSTMGGWYCPHGIYRPESFGGLSVTRFVEAVRAEGFAAQARGSLIQPLHLHPLLNECDVYQQGRPTRIANAARDVRQAKGTLPITEGISAFTVPPFKRFRPALIEQYAAAFRKVAQHAPALLADDPGDPADWWSSAVEQSV